MALVAGDGWSNADKGRIVAESFAPGAVVVRAECGVDLGWLAAVLRVVKPLS